MFCRDKHAFVATKHVFCRDKTRLLSQQKFACGTSNVTTKQHSNHFEGILEEKQQNNNNNNNNKHTHKNNNNKKQSLCKATVTRLETYD